MYYVATIHTYDVMTQVQVHGSVRGRDDTPAGDWHTVFECTTTFPGTGENDPREWLRDACIGLLEEL